MDRNYWQEFLGWLSEEELIRFARRAQLDGRLELAKAFEARLEEFRQAQVILDLQAWQAGPANSPIHPMGEA